jgi:hypothetical protein
MTKMMVPTNPIIVLAMLRMAVLLTLDWFIGSLAYPRRGTPVAVAESPSDQAEPTGEAA